MPDKETTRIAVEIHAHAMRLADQVRDMRRLNLADVSGRKSRDRAIRRHLARTEPLLLHSVTNQTRDHLRCGMLYPIANRDSEARGFGAIEERYILGQAQTDFAPEVDARVHIDIHVLKRMIERNHVRSIQQFRDLIAPALGWASMAAKVEANGKLAIPTRIGLFFSEVEPYLDDRLKRKTLPGDPLVTRIKTFIDRESLNVTKRTGHDLLIDAGALDLAPRFPSSRIDDARLKLLSMCRSAGRNMEAFVIDRDHRREVLQHVSMSVLDPVGADF